MRRQAGSQQEEGTALRDLHLWQVQAVRDLLLVGAIAGLVWAGYALRTVTVPLLVALLLAYLFEPLVAWLTAHLRLRRQAVVGGLIATVGVLLLGALAICLPVVVAQTAALVRDYQQGRFRDTALDLSNRLPEPWRHQAAAISEYLPQHPSAREDAAAPPATLPPPEAFGAGEGDAGARLFRGARAAAGVIGRIVALGFLAFLIPFYFFFFSVWYPALVDFTRGLLPTARRQRVAELLARMDRVVAAFVRGRIVISLLMGLMLAAGWWIARVPYPIVLGLVVGAFCAVPYLGIIGVPVAVLLLAFSELGRPPELAMAWWGILLWPSLVYAIVQIVEGYLLTPLIAGRATNLDPVTILVAVLAGGSIMGLYGMLLGIPVAACAKILCTDVLLPKVRAWSAGQASDPLPLRRR